MIHKKSYYIISAIYIAAVFSLLLFQNVTYACYFDDVQSDNTFYEAIEYSKEKGIVAGYSDGSFQPENPVNRAEFTKIIINSAFSEDEINGCLAKYPSLFGDISANAWYAKYICLAKAKGIINGYNDGLFRPANLINFAEAAKIVINTLKQKIESGTDIWYRPYIELLGSSYAIPTSIKAFSHYLTRGEMVEIIWRIKEKKTDRPSYDYSSIEKKTYKVINGHSGSSDTAPSGGSSSSESSSSGGSGSASSAQDPAPAQSASVSYTNSAISVFPSTAIWRQNIASASLDSKSDEMISYLESMGGFGLGRMQIDFSIEVLRTDENDPKLSFERTGNFYTPDCDYTPVPIPQSGAIEGENGYSCEGGGDCHLIVNSPHENRLYEMWKADITNGNFQGGCLAVFDTSTTYNNGERGLQCTSADAAGLPISPLLFTADEVAAGSIDHAIRFILPNNRIRNRKFVLPATHSTGATSGPDYAPAFGTRLRLRADYPVSSLPAGAQVVARALQQYGMILADGGNVALTAMSDRFSTAKWNGLLEARDLDAIQITDFEVVQEGAESYWSGDCTRQQLIETDRSSSAQFTVTQSVPEQTPQTETETTPTEKPQPQPQPASGNPDNSGGDKNLPPMTINCIHQGTGTDYRVGPGQDYENISDIDWNNLKAGDTVRIFWKSEPYRERIHIKGKGTPDQPIRVCGVPGPNNQPPVISGENAVTRSDLDYNPYVTQLALITIMDREYYASTSNIHIEGLELTQTGNDYKFYNREGQLTNYSEGASCIRVQEGENHVFRGNIIHDCGSGIFTMNQGYNIYSITKNILIEGNSIYDNGDIDSYLSHNLYIQSIGTTYQFNHLGRIKEGSKGANLKDRGAGTIIRYNWIEGGKRLLDLVEAEDYIVWVLEEYFLADISRETSDTLTIIVDGKQTKGDSEVFLEQVQENEKAYRKTHVYGNYLFRKGSAGDAWNPIHYGHDNEAYKTRKGTLYFFNNTFVTLSDRSDVWNSTIFDLSTPEEKAEVFNNIFYFAPETPGEVISNFHFTRDSGVVNLGKNWITEGWQTGKGTVLGSENLITGPYNQPPIDLNTLLPLADSPAIDAGQSLPAGLSDNYPVDHGYSHGTVSGKLRTQKGSAIDLGASEY